MVVPAIDRTTRSGRNASAGDRSNCNPLFRAAAYVGLGSPTAGEKPPVLSFADAKNFPGYDEEYGNPLRILMAMVGLVLLIALTNVVMLLHGAECDAAAGVFIAAGAGRGARRAAAATADREPDAGDRRGRARMGLCA